MRCGYFLIIIYITFINFGFAQDFSPILIDYDWLDHSDRLREHNSFLYSLENYSNGIAGQNNLSQVVTKRDSKGEIEFQKIYSSSSGNVFCTGWSLISDGVIFSLYYDNPEESKIINILLDFDGNEIWKIDYPDKILDTVEYELRFYEFIQLPDKNIKCFYNLISHNDPDGIVVKNGWLDINPLGEDLGWNLFLDSEENVFSLGIQYLSNYGYIKESVPVPNNILRPKNIFRHYNLEDSLLWEYILSPNKYADGFGPMIVDSMGNLYFTWRYDSTGLHEFNTFPTITSLDKNGQFRWQHSYGNYIGAYFFNDIDVMSDGSVVACGFSGGAEVSGKVQEGWIVKVNSLGEQSSERKYIVSQSGSFGNSFKQITIDENNCMYLSGEYINKDNNLNILLIAVDSVGCIIEDCSVYSYFDVVNSASRILESNVNIINNNGILFITNAVEELNNNYFYFIYSLDGKIVETGRILSNNYFVELDRYPMGLYVCCVKDRIEKHSISKLFFNKGQ